MSREIKILHIEPTDVCQAACPQCARETDDLFDKNQHHHLTIEQISSAIDRETLCSLDKMFMCGNYGDPAAGKYTLDIYQWLRDINSNITLGMNTNGAIRTTEWWQELASILDRPLDYVVFSIDGLEDTNHIYRKHVDWHKLIENAQAFIAAGGRAHWDMLVYRHNQHQVDQSRDLAQKMGFTWFRAKVSKRPMTGDLGLPIGYAVPIKNKSTVIDCIALKEQSLYIDAQGRVSPCCWLGARQIDFIRDIRQVQETWGTDRCDPTCQATCSVSSSGQTLFHDQWARAEAL